MRIVIAVCPKKTANPKRYRKMSTALVTAILCFPYGRAKISPRIVVTGTLKRRSKPPLTLLLSIILIVSKGSAATRKPKSTSKSDKLKPWRMKGKKKRNSLLRNTSKNTCWSMRLSVTSNPGKSLIFL
jgi:hypothetical protein